jgi:hypothetical protein
VRVWLATFALADDAQYVAEDGEWVLFRSRYPVAPLTSPDWPLEKPPPDSMHEKLAETARKLRESQQNAPEIPLELQEAPEQQPPM